MVTLSLSFPGTGRYSPKLHSIAAVILLRSVTSSKRHLPEQFLLTPCSLALPVADVFFGSDEEGVFVSSSSIAAVARASSEPPSPRRHASFFFLHFFSLSELSHCRCFAEASAAAWDFSAAGDLCLVRITDASPRPDLPSLSPLHSPPPEPSWSVAAIVAVCAAPLFFCSERAPAR